MARPWSISSRKKLSLPKMSWNSPAARTASSYCPSRSRVCTSPDGQPVRGDQPLGVRCEQLAVHARLVEEALEARRGDESRNRLCMPSVVSAQHRHVGVGAAAGDVVAALLAASPLPQRTRLRSKREVSGVR